MLRKYSDVVPETPDEPDAQQPIDVVTWLTDMLYTGVGLGVLAVNRIQVARRSAQQRLGNSEPVNPGLAALADILADPERAQVVIAKLREELRDIDERLGGVETRFSGFLERIEPELPDGARELAGALRGLADDHATQIRAVLGLPSR